MSVSVAICSVAELFQGEGISTSLNDTIQGQLTIPEYQRPYCWQDKQLSRLLQDIAEHRSHTPKMAYYLGSVILHHENQTLNIIDGQQRLTSLALIAYISGQFTDLELRYESPISQQQIMCNLTWLQDYKNQWIENLDFDQLQLSLVITTSEDEAYQFFETQNTGGVRLSGPDIIKAHHLRAIHEENKSAVNQFAELWENLGDLNPVVDLLLRGRYWQNLNFRNYPLHNQTPQIRTSIVTELAEHTNKGKEDVAFGHITRIYPGNGSEYVAQAQVGYDLRQPLNSGINTIHYLQYFEQLRQKYLLSTYETDDLADFSRFYHQLVCKLEGCSYLKQLFDACLLLYISLFGEQYLAVGSKKIFRVVYSRRVENQKAVKEKSVPAFIREHPVLDWIAVSYTPQQCFTKLDSYTLSVNPEGLNKNTVKSRFVRHVIEFFGLTTLDEDYANQFGSDFDKYIVNLGDKG